MSHELGAMSHGLRAPHYTTREERTPCCGNTTCACEDTLCGFYENLRFVLLVLPVLLVVLVELLAQVLTCCCFCRRRPGFASLSYNLPYNLDCIRSFWRTFTFKKPAPRHV